MKVSHHVFHCNCNCNFSYSVVVHVVPFGLTLSLAHIYYNKVELTNNGKPNSLVTYDVIKFYSTDPKVNVKKNYPLILQVGPFQNTKKWSPLVKLSSLLSLTPLNLVQKAFLKHLIKLLRCATTPRCKTTPSWPRPSACPKSRSEDQRGLSNALTRIIRPVR